MKFGVFISYSHEDARYVSPVIQLIRAMRKDLVFQDTQNLAAGKLWEPQLLKALHEAKIIIVFWCRHSARSKYVKKEYETAIKDKKDILPLLLDGTRLVKSLAAYQWIDLRTTFFHAKPRLTLTKGPDSAGSGGNKKRSAAAWSPGIYRRKKDKTSMDIASAIYKKLNEKIPAH